MFDDNCLAQSKVTLARKDPTNSHTTDRELRGAVAAVTPAVGNLSAHQALETPSFRHDLFLGSGSLSRGHVSCANKKHGVPKAFLMIPRRNPHPLYLSCSLVVRLAPVR